MGVEKRLAREEGVCRRTGYGGRPRNYDSVEIL